MANKLEEIKKDLRENGIGDFRLYPSSYDPEIFDISIEDPGGMDSIEYRLALIGYTVVPAYWWRGDGGNELRGHLHSKEKTFNDIKCLADDSLRDAIFKYRHLGLDINEALQEFLTTENRT